MKWIENIGQTFRTSLRDITFARSITGQTIAPKTRDDSLTAS